MLKARVRLTAHDSGGIDRALIALSKKVNQPQFAGWALHGHVTITEIVAPRSWGASITLEGAVSLEAP